MLFILVLACQSGFSLPKTGILFSFFHLKLHCRLRGTMHKSAKTLTPTSVRTLLRLRSGFKRCAQHCMCILLLQQCRPPTAKPNKGTWQQMFNKSRQRQLYTATTTQYGEPRLAICTRLTPATGKRSKKEDRRGQERFKAKDRKTKRRTGNGDCRFPPGG